MCFAFLFLRCILPKSQTLDSIVSQKILFGPFVADKKKGRKKKSPWLNLGCFDLKKVVQKKKKTGKICVALMI